MRNFSGNTKKILNIINVDRGIFKRFPKCLVNYLLFLQIQISTCLLFHLLSNALNRIYDKNNAIKTIL